MASRHVGRKSRAFREGLRLVIGLCLLTIPVAGIRGATLEERLRGLVNAHEGKVSVAVKHLGTGVSWEHNAREVMPTASLIKFPVMIETYRQAKAGLVDLKTPIVLKDEDKVPGSGILTVQFSAGMTLSLRDAVRLMIAYSDNTATNLVVDKIGLPSTSAYMKELGRPDTRLHSKVYRRDTSVEPERSKIYGLGSTTAADMIALLEALHAGKLVGPEESKAMLDHMLHCEDKDLLPRFLPRGVKVAQKTGAVANVRTAAGILMTPNGPVAVCVLTAENRDQRWVPENAAEVLIAEIAREAYAFFQTKDDLSKNLGKRPIKIGDSGLRVEELQRALNAVLKPSPNLSVDGDFGEGTQSVVKRFQTERKLEVTGIVDEATARALEVKDVKEPPAKPPGSDAKPAARPSEDLSGPPAVTAKAWAIADGATGNILWGGNADAPLDQASTTKLMTAHLIHSLAKADPSVWDEVVTFSRRADATSGSTSAIEAGERITVAELMYGLMLPSGNDAAIALAEHFGHRLRKSEPHPQTPQSSLSLDPVQAFVAAMNAEARTLGLTHTRFQNPHGLTAADHHSGAGDLARLAATALKDPRFAALVSARRHSSQLVDAENYARSITWSNTNQLLDFADYDGVKTGTTNAAGACLVASARRNGQHRIVVVLGSAASASRYADARNLFRWAWSQTPAARP